MNTDSPTSLEESPDVSQQDIFRAVKQQIKFQQQPFREPHPGCQSSAHFLSHDYSEYEQGQSKTLSSELLKSQDLLIRGLIIESTVDKPLVVNSLAISVQNNDFMRDKRIKWFTDNQNVVSIIVHILKGSMKPYLQDIAYDICVTCLKHNVFFKVEWIPRAQNEIEDYISRIINTDDCRNAVFRNDIAELSNDLDSQLGFIPDLLAYSKSDNIVKKYYLGFLQWKKWAK
ncbi:unnamed protein product [Mytilus coruscus]|uniref:RNase H type-1 domain-containing protein n=1 Tax=Mytilus coruscus TaxID=42192 RepID=A0A6J8BAT2_MYTCO|nr:unnamed protein product [Mytilus coruscus]